MIYFLLLVILIFITVFTWFYFDILSSERNGYYDDDYNEPYTVHREFKADKE